ncbi:MULTISPECIES: FtsX-like permease family protein [unclassified Spirosoma]|uniref:FtsX-like permease family protein n=1 Tax=unclassified Spirosoma TaxID=2621999 RepID=UPI000AB9A340|nr:MULTISPECIES: FtsX-like permease family protein [unclassified Spirosoma]
MRRSPPRWAEQLLIWLHPSETLEEVQGDLDELYTYWYRRAGEPQASLRYVLNVISALPPFVRRRHSQSSEYPQPSSLHPSMLSNYLKIALRTLWRSKGHVAINVIGLAVAFCICTFLFLTSYLQLTFDSFHTDGDRIFQTYYFSNDPEKPSKSGTMPLALLPALKADFPELEAGVQIVQGRKSLVEYKGVYFDKLITLTDPDFLTMFSFPMLKGSRTGALHDLSSIVISDDMAKAVFGTDDPMGKTLLVGSNGDQKQYIVTGVMATPPYNSSIQFDALVRVENVPNYQARKQNWYDNSHRVFLKLPAQISQATFEARLKAFTQKYLAQNLDNLKKKGAKPDSQGDLFAIRLQKLANVHFDRDIDGRGAPIAMIYVLLGIAFFILLIACINFINLSIARSFMRAREVGVRKSLGALKTQLFVQIWSESTLICLVGFGIGLLLAYWLLPAFNASFQTRLDLHHLFQPGFIGLIVGVFALVTLLAGGYPAWQMAAFKPVEVLKGKISLKRPGFLRNSLIVTQFSLSTLLACATIIALQQVDFLREQPLGFQKEQVISIPVGNQVNGRQVLQRMRNILAADPTVVAVTGTDINLGRGKDRVSSRSSVGFTFKGREISSDLLLVDYDYFKTLNIKLLAGRDFNPTYAADSVNRVVVTASMAKLLREKNPVGMFYRDDADTSGAQTQIIGVVPDFHLYSLADQAKPITIHISHAEPIRYIFVRVSPQSLANSMDRMKQIWKDIAPQSEFMGSFLDENVDAWYQSEEMMSRVFTLASSIAILLSCIGLFAVALIVIEQRTKEIGIRKVMGASIPGIIVVLSRDFVKLVLIALAIAIPIAWFGMDKWLSGYAFRIDISPWVFVVVGLSAVLIAIATVSFHSIKAALVNPVKSLRSE